MFDDVESFYNPNRKHRNDGILSPVDFETRQQKPNEAGVWETTGTLQKDSFQPTKVSGVMMSLISGGFRRPNRT